MTSLREYFENGCMCILTEKIEKCNHLDDAKVEGYYLKNCHCSRHPESARRYCWDREDKRSNPQIVKDFIRSKLEE